MKKEKIILQLGVEIDSLKAHIQRLKKDNYTPHQLDVELLQQKTRQFYELLFDLQNEVSSQGNVSPKPPVKKEPPPPPKEKVVERPETKPPQPLEKTEEKIDVKVVEKEVIQAEIKSEPAEPKAEPEEVAAEKHLETKPLKEEAAVSTTSAKPAEPKSHFDLFSETSSATLGDKFSGNEEQSLADKMQGSRITDLRQSVGINEKFLFINELFNGDMGRYNKAVDELNEMKSLKGAETYLMELKVQNQWDDDLPAYLKLKDLVERKF